MDRNFPWKPYLINALYINVTPSPLGAVKVLKGKKTQIKQFQIREQKVHFESQYIHISKSQC